MAWDSFKRDSKIPGLIVVHTAIPHQGTIIRKYGDAVYCRTIDAIAVPVLVTEL
jgi:hypothetical protein